MSEQQPIQVVLTLEQQTLVRRLSGQHVEAIEVQADDVQATHGPLADSPQGTAGG